MVSVTEFPLLYTDIREVWKENRAKLKKIQSRKARKRSAKIKR